jgi:hypothetical protein
MIPDVSHAAFIFGTSNVPSSDNVNFSTNTAVTSFTGLSNQSNVTILFNNPDSGTKLDTNNGQSVTLDAGGTQAWTTLTETVQTSGIGLTAIDMKLQPHNAVTTNGSADWVNLTVFGPTTGPSGVTSTNLNFGSASGQSDFEVSAAGSDVITKMVWTVHFGTTNNIDSQKQFSIVGTAMIADPGPGAVPEPASLVMMSLGSGTVGLIGVATRLRRRK